MKTIKTILFIMAGALVWVSCDKETREKLSETKKAVSNATTVVSHAQEAKKETDKLKELTPLTNDQLKAWLPETLGGMKRTGFQVGKTGYMNVASVEGTYKTEEGEQFKVQVIDGAGQMGSSLILGMGMATKMDIEEETESKHRKSVEWDGVKALQTYHKKRNDTTLQFIYDERFMVTVNAKDMSVEETWDLVEQIDLDELTD
ncbi:hypothetical protein [Croceiramulus getboli]|nr:hypothetical protein P8624_08830 [Flavobacteriaceae bacterium YJPT1-3]